MFKWLANMIIKTPVQGTCSCCEGQKERLKQMQKAILDEEKGESERECRCGDGCRCREGGECRCGDDCHCREGGECRCGDECRCRNKESAGEVPDYSGMTSFASAGYSLECRFDDSAKQYKRSAKYVPASASENRQ